MRTFLRTLVLAGVSLAAASATAQAGPQPRHEVDLAVTYDAERSNLVTDPTFWRQGGAVALSAEFYRGLGIAMNVAGSRRSNINGGGVGLTAITATFGPRYQWTPRTGKYALFGEGLIGISHGLDSVFPSVRGAQDEYESFALQVGGGLDVRVGHRFAIRAIQADWVRTEFPNSTTDVQNSLRLGAGVVLRLGGWRNR
jgi:hypothetical protein